MAAAVDYLDVAIVREIDNALTRKAQRRKY